MSTASAKESDAPPTTVHTPSPGRPAVPGRIQRGLLITLAIASLAMAVVGAFLPGLPSTEFVLLAAWASARGSPRLNAWLRGHRLFGPLMHDWENGRRVSYGAKWSATVSMSGGALFLAFSSLPAGVVLALIVCMAAVLLWLWTRQE